MDSEEILKLIKNKLGDTFKSELISHTMYDPDKLQKKVSIAIYEEVEGKGLYKRFIITVDDNKPSFI